MIQLGPIVMPCLYCRARPGQACEGLRGTFHLAREADADAASALIDATPSFSITDADIAAIVAAERAERG